MVCEKCKKDVSKVLGTQVGSVSFYFCFGCYSDYEKKRTEVMRNFMKQFLLEGTNT